MRPIDIKLETWASIQDRLEADRKAVWNGFLMYGPCTTRALAERIPMSLLTVRPRCTELLDMMLLELVGKNKDGGIYGYVSIETARERFEALQEQYRGPQQRELFEAA